MLKRELVFAAIAASMLTVGTLSAQGGDCMDLCREFFGDTVDDGGITYELDRCTQEANREGSVTTCTYVAS